MNKTVRNLLISGLLVTSIVIPSWANIKGNDDNLAVKKNSLNYEIDAETANINTFKVLQANKIYTNMNMINRMGIGEEMTINLYENPSTNHLWNIRIDNPELLSYEEEWVENESSKEDSQIAICGAPSEKMYTFEALNKGITKVTFELKSLSELDSEPVEVREYIIEVK